MHRAEGVTEEHDDTMVGGLSAAEQDEAKQIRPWLEAKVEFERGYMEKVLAITDGNISKAELVTGLARRNLYDLMYRTGLMVRAKLPRRGKAARDAARASARVSNARLRDAAIRRGRAALEADA